MSDKKEISQEQFERIEKYLLKQMTSDEQSLFETTLQADEALAQEVTLQKELMNTVQAGAMKQRLLQIHHHVDIRSLSNGRFWYAIAAGVALLFAAGLFLLNAPSADEKLFAQYAAIDMGLPVPMSAMDKFAFHDAMVDYKNEQYEKAIGKWTVLLNANPQNDTLIYYIGASHFNMKQYERASSNFEVVTRMTESSLHNKAEWYAVLSYLQLKQFEKIRSISPRSDSPYRADIRHITEGVKE